VPLVTRAAGTKCYVVDEFGLLRNIGVAQACSMRRVESAGAVWLGGTRAGGFESSVSLSRPLSAGTGAAQRELIVGVKYTRRAAAQDRARARPGDKLGITMNALPASGLFGSATG